MSGTKSVNPGPDIPFYTFVYAKNGVWSNQCVTDNNGSGALALQTCTLGKNQYQDFYALDGTGAKSGEPADQLGGRSDPEHAGCGGQPGVLVPGSTRRS